MRENFRAAAFSSAFRGTSIELPCRSSINEIALIHANLARLTPGAPLPAPLRRRFVHPIKRRLLSSAMPDEMLRSSALVACARSPHHSTRNRFNL